MLEVATLQFPCVSMIGISRDPELQRCREDLSRLDEDHPLRPVILSCLKDNPKERPNIGIVTVLAQLLADKEVQFDTYALKDFLFPMHNLYSSTEYHLYQATTLFVIGQRLLNQ